MGINRELQGRRGAASCIIALVVALLSVLATTAHAQEGVRRPAVPSLNGSIGLFRTLSAEALPEGSITLSLHGEFFTADGFTFPNTSTSRLAADLAGSWHPYAFEAFEQPFQTEISLGWRAAAVKFKNDGSILTDTNSLLQVSSLSLYMKLTRARTAEDDKELYSYGVGLGFSIPSKVDAIGPDFGQTSLALDGLFTVDFQAHDDDWVPVKLHANIGLFYNNTSATEGFIPGLGVSDSNTILRFALGESTYNQIRFRLGAEYSHRVFTPFLEWNMNAQTTLPPGLGIFDSPMSLIPGVRIRPTPAVNVSLGVEIALAQAARPTVSVLPDWNLIMGASYVFVPKPPPPPPPLIVPEERAVAVSTTGKVTGIVYDANSNLPIGKAFVSFPDRDLSTIVTNKDSGAYTTFELPAGPVELRVEREGYIPRSAAPVVVAGQTITQDFYLVPEVEEAAIGTYRGTVQSIDGQFLAAKVTMFGTENSRTTEEGVGQFVMELPAGEHRAEASAPGYFPEAHSFTLQPAQILVHDFVLKKKPEIKKKKFVEIKDNRIEISQKIFFTTGKATVLEQSFPVLVEIADVLKENPHLQLVEIGGHSDSRGNDAYNKKLSERRAASVRQFLIQQGVEASRLTAVGYGEEVPLVFPDDTKEKQARNRRVEFVILKQGTPEQAP
ncbi:MAG: OmpA family protein [Chrysiogenetes bacterium]|nr:OmpA family protein [Chrysiogenetes bacterium]